MLSVQEEIQDAAKDDFRAGRSIENRVVWPHWMGWLISLTGIGVLVRGHSLRRSVKESSERIA